MGKKKIKTEQTGAKFKIEQTWTKKIQKPKKNQPMRTWVRGWRFVFERVAVAGLVFCVDSFLFLLSFHPPCRFDTKESTDPLVSVEEGLWSMRVGIHPVSMSVICDCVRFRVRFRVCHCVIHCH